MSGRDWRDFIIASVVALLAFFVPAGYAWARAMQVSTIGVQQWQRTATIGAGIDGAFASSIPRSATKPKPTSAANGCSVVFITNISVTVAEDRDDRHPKATQTFVRQTHIVRYQCPKGALGNGGNMAVLVRATGKAG